MQQISKIRVSSPSAIWPTLAGLCASLSGIGLARFAYTPLLPAIVGADWFDAADAVYLGAANLLGYLVGALLAEPLATRLSAVVTLRTMMLVVVISLIACAWPASFYWFAVWRLLSGLAGGVLMVLAAPTVLPHIAQTRRGIASGVIFTGVGLGIVISGTLIPLLLQQGVTQTWLGLGLLSLLLTVLAWRRWPRTEITAATHQIEPLIYPASALRGLYIVYGLCAFGLVPHMIFLVDFIARDLGQGLAVGANFWVVLGIGAIAGPLVLGHWADRYGYAVVLRISLLVESIAIALPALSSCKTVMGDVALFTSCILVGAFIPGSVILVLGRIRQLLAHHALRQKMAWSTATISFALFQAAGAYSLSYLFERSNGNYSSLFLTGGFALMIAVIVDVFVTRFTRSKKR